MKKIAIIFFFAIIISSQFPSFPQDGQLFKWKQQSPQGNTIRFLKMFDANTWYMAGASGLFMKTTDGGVSFWLTHKAGLLNPSIPGAFSPVYDGHFINQTTGVLVCQGAITRTTDGGATWNIVYNAATIATNLYQAYFRTATIGYVVGSAGTLVKTTDAGATWNAIASGTLNSLYDVFTSNDTLLVVSSSGGAIRTSTDAGVTWATQAPGGTAVLNKLTFKDNLVGVAHGSLSKLILTTDGGFTWVDKSAGLPASSTFYDSKFIGDTIYVTGNSNFIQKSTDRGTTWTAVSFLNPTQPWTSTFYATDIVGSRLVTGGGFGLLQKVDAGTNPVALTTMKKAGITYDIWASSFSQKVIAVGAPSAAGVQDQIMASSDGGNNWTLSSTTLASSLTSKPVFVSDEIQPEYVKGKAETSDSPISLATFRDIHMIDDTNGWIVGNNGAAYKTSNGGVTWDSVVIAGTTSTQIFYRVDFIDANNGWIYSNTGDTAGTVLKTTNGGATWTKYKLGAFSSSVDHQIYSQSRVNANYQWVVNYTPNPIKTTDGGLTWTVQPLIDNWTASFLWDIKMIDTLTGWACGGSGKLYKTTNGGALWDSIYYTGKNTLISWYKINVAGPNNITLVGNTGTVLMTTDGGITWSWQNTSVTLTNYALAAGFTSAAHDSAAFYIGGSAGSIFKMEKFRVPVELTAFFSSINGNSVTLNWTSASETNNLAYEIERSKNRSNFLKIGKVNGNGTTLQIHSYTFVDTDLQIGSYYYRVKQVDYDGTYKYYDLNNSIEIGAPANYSLNQNFPNPFNPSTVLQYSLAKPGMVSLKIYNMLGKEVYTVVDEYQQAGIYNRSFSSEKTGLTSGVYFFTILSGDFRATKKMLLLK